MSLRLRLIVAFFFLSVLPLAAVTVVSYTNNVKAVRGAAEKDANELARELTDRMQLVTAQLSDRVMELMRSGSNATVTQVADARPPAPRTSNRPPTRPSPTPTPASPSQTTTTQPVTGAPLTQGNAQPSLVAGPMAPAAVVTSDHVAHVLGETAMLLNNVELRGWGRGGGSNFRFDQNMTGAGGGRGGTGPGSSPDRGLGAPPPGGRRSPPGGTRSASDPRPAPASSPASRVVPVVPVPSPPPPPPMVGGVRGDPLHPTGKPIVTVRPPRDDAKTPADAKERIMIDLAPIRQELYRQILPTGKTPETLTAEERQRVNREVTQRMRGIMQGIQLSSIELQRKAADAQRESTLAQAAEVARLAEATASAAASSSAKVGQSPKAPVTQVTPSSSPSVPQPAPASPRPASPPPSPPAPAAGPTPAPATPPTPGRPAATPAMTRKMQLSGNQLVVDVEQNGQVVEQVNAEINLPNVLAAVFSTTKRDRDEVPFAVGKDGNVYAPTEEDRRRISGLGPALAADGPPTRTTIAGEWVVVTTADPSGSGVRFGIARPVGDSMHDVRRAAARNASIGLGFIGLAIVGIVPLSGRLTRNLTSLTGAVSRIANGDFRARVPVKSKDEFGRLATAFNKMAEDVERHQASAVQQERIRGELELGRQIQHEMLPHAPFRLGLTEINGVSVPAREVGGDFFNYFEVEGGQIALLVGDVSGKGVGAALLMANIQASLRTRLALGQDLSAIADAIDRDIGANSPGAVYATLFVGILDPLTRKLRFVNAGHNPQYLLRRTGGLDRMESTGLPVGMVAGRGYSERQAQLEAGDVLFLYTDGCVEAENEREDMYGADRLEALLTSRAATSPDDILQRVEAAVKAFRGAREPFDDETMMAVRVG